MVSKFQLIFLFSFVVCATSGPSAPGLAECAIKYIEKEKVDASESGRIDSHCDAIISSEIVKFYDEVRDLITNGVNVENLDNAEFIKQETCILASLRHFNVSQLYIKGIAYRKLNKAHKSDHSFNQKMTSPQILLLYALQVCEPRSFYARHSEKIFSMNMRATNAQAHCLVNHLNENGVDEPYQLNECTESFNDLDVVDCLDVVRSFVKKYYNVIDRARNFSIFNLNPVEARKCRAVDDQSLINNMILLTIFPRLNLTSEQMETEKSRFFEVARESAKSFFKCISMYD